MGLAVLLDMVDDGEILYDPVPGARHATAPAPTAAGRRERPPGLARGQRVLGLGRWAFEPGRSRGRGEATWQRPRPGGALTVLMGQRDYADVMREAQEIVEPATKGVFRHLGVEPPKRHDVGPLLQELSGRGPDGPWSQRAAESPWLRHKREFTFYGDLDFIPTVAYREDGAQRALDGTHVALAERQPPWVPPTSAVGRPRAVPLEPKPGALPQGSRRSGPGIPTAWPRPHCARPGGRRTPPPRPPSPAGW